jgi:hypothetical protein
MSADEQRLALLAASLRALDDSGFERLRAAPQSSVLRNVRVEAVQGDSSPEAVSPRTGLLRSNSADNLSMNSSASGDDSSTPSTSGRDSSQARVP